MAFLLPALIPALQALGLGALSGAGAAAVKKIVGDAVPDDQAASLLALSIANPDSQMLTSSLSPDQVVGLKTLTTDLGATPNLFLNPTVLSGHSGTGFLAQPAVSSPASGAAANQLSQTLSDAAALQQLPQTQTATEQHFRAQTIPGAMTTSYQPLQPLSASDTRNMANANAPNSVNQLSAQRLNPLLSGLQGVLFDPSSAQAHVGTTPQGMTPTHQQSQMSPTQRLSIQPSTNLLQAAQPIFKTENNQGVLTARAPTLGTQNPFAQGVAGAGGSSGFQSTAKSVGNELLGAVRDAATGAASNAVQQIGGTATAVAKQGLSKAGGWLGSLISNGISSIAKKIIGDAPPIGFDNFNARRGGFIPPISMQEVIGTPIGWGDMGGRLPSVEGVVHSLNAQKIVGDAPPGGQDEVMTEDQMNAASDNLKTSVTFNLMSRLVLNEQVLVSSTSLPRGMNEKQLNNFYARDLESLVGTYRQSEVQTVFGLKGMTLQYSSFPFANYNKATDEYVVGHSAYHEFWATGVALETSRLAPPCTANTTLNQLAPLLAGAALGEYSSQLRVKTFSTDLDLMVRASAIAMNNIQSQQGYSFCLPLVKAIGYILQRVQLLGGEVNDLVGDVYFRPSGDNPQYVTVNRTFPLECLTGDLIWNGAACHNFWASVISEADFIKAAVGITQFENWRAFSPQYWGLTTAIVFIPANDKSNQQMNSIRMASQLAYPIKLCQLTGRWHYYNRDGVYTMMPGDVGAIKKAGLTRIPGPYQNVLFVIMGVREASSAGVSIGDGTGTDGHFIHLNGVDNGPADPYIAPEGNNPIGYALEFVTSAPGIPAWMTFIKEWETTYGNNSDRSSAMRFWADHGVLFSNFFFATNGLDVGAQPTISFHTWADPTRTNIGTPEAPNWKISAYEAVTDLPAAWYQSGSWINGNAFTALMHCAKTATLLPVSKLKVPLESGEAYAWDINAPDFSRLPFEDVMISFLVYKKWITPNEEYPETVLDDAARLGHTITVMSNIMAGVSDLTVQQRDFMFNEVIFPPIILQVVPMAMMRAKNKLWPALEEVLTNGIQFPQYWNNRDVNMHCYSGLGYWEVSLPLLVPTGIIDGGMVASLARIPVSILGQWFSPLYPQYIQLRLNLPVMRPQRNYITVAGVTRTMYQAEYSEDNTGLLGKALSPISWLVWRLSLGVIIGPPPVNNGWLVQTANNQGTYTYVVHMEQPDASRNQVLVREYGAGNVTIPPTTEVSLPMGEFIIKRCLTTALQPFSILMQGPQDAFVGVGSGSTAYQMFVQTNTPQAIFVSEVWATIPDWLFSPDGLQSARDTI